MKKSINLSPIIPKKIMKGKIFGKSFKDSLIVFKVVFMGLSKNPSLKKQAQPNNKKGKNEKCNKQSSEDKNTKSIGKKDKEKDNNNWKEENNKKN